MVNRLTDGADGVGMIGRSEVFFLRHASRIAAMVPVTRTKLTGIPIRWIVWMLASNGASSLECRVTSAKEMVGTLWLLILSMEASRSVRFLESRIWSVKEGSEELRWKLGRGLTTTLANWERLLLKILGAPCNKETPSLAVQPEGKNILPWPVIWIVDLFPAQATFRVVHSLTL